MSRSSSKWWRRLIDWFTHPVVPPGADGPSIPPAKRGPATSGAKFVRGLWIFAELLGIGAFLTGLAWLLAPEAPVGVFATVMLLGVCLATWEEVVSGR